MHIIAALLCSWFVSYQLGVLCCHYLGGRFLNLIIGAGALIGLGLGGYIGMEIQQWIV